MADDRYEHAIDSVARQIAWWALDTEIVNLANVPVYGNIPEADVAAIHKRLEQIADEVSVERPTYDAACEWLETRKPT